jgi:hypothetical protein
MALAKCAAHTELGSSDSVTYGRLLPCMMDFAHQTSAYPTILVEVVLLEGHRWRACKHACMHACRTRKLSGMWVESRSASRTQRWPANTALRSHTWQTSQYGVSRMPRRARCCDWDCLHSTRRRLRVVRVLPTAWKHLQVRLHAQHVSKWHAAFTAATQPFGASSAASMRCHWV